MPQRWLREVFHVIFLFICALYDQIFSLFCMSPITSVARRVVSAHRRIEGRSTRPILQPARPGIDPRRGLPSRGGLGQPSGGSAAGLGWHLGATVDGTPGTLLNPFGVAVVPSTGEVLVSDLNRHQVVRFRSIDDDTVVGTLGTGQGSGSTQFYWPCGLAVLDGSHRPLVCFSFYFVMIIRCDILTSYLDS